MARFALRILVFAFAASLLVVRSTSAMEESTKSVELPKLFGTFQPEVGVWSRYSVVETNTDKKSTMRMAIVGKEGDAYWYEVHHQEGDKRNIIKMLVKGNPNEPDNIQRLILKTGDQPAAEMPKDFVAMGRRMALHMFERRSGVSAEAGPQEYSVEEMPPAEVTVPAGTFQASLRRIRDAEGEVVATYYYNEDIAPFGVVSSETDTTVMELLAHGEDATSAITGTPDPMMTPPGMPAGMPRGMPPGMKNKPKP